jgi:hypothetical protein
MAAQLWRVVAIYRVITLSYAAALIIRDHNGYAHPAYGLAALVVMSCWTAVTIAAYARPAGRNLWLITADGAVAMTLVIATAWVETADRINAGAPTLPAFWAAAPVLAAAVAGGPWAGIAAALAISGADLAEHQQLQAQSTFNGLVLLLIAGALAANNQHHRLIPVRAQRAEQPVRLGWLQDLRQGARHPHQRHRPRRP